MSPRHPTPKAYFAEIEANRANLRGPKDGTVCYTNGGQDLALMFVANERAAGRDATTLEQTPYGERLQNDALWRTTPENRAFNNAEHDRQIEAGVQNVDPRLAGTNAVWAKASQIYCEEARGMVIVVTSDKPIDEKSFFARYERHALIRNSNVTHINGIERKQLEARLDAVEQTMASHDRTSTGFGKMRTLALHQEAVAKLNADIERGAPHLGREISKIRETPSQIDPQSRWDTHHDKTETKDPDIGPDKSR